MRENRQLAQAIFNKLDSASRVGEEPAYVKALFGPQYRFFKDPSKKKAALCSRRAGKTEAIAAWLIDGGEDDPGGMSVYVALSRNNCRKILWRTMEDLERRHQLGLRFHEQDNQLHIVLPNGHKIWLAGCKDQAEIEKFRGMKFRRAAIDEGASYGPYLRELVFDVLEPALLDMNGELAVIGTPGAVPTGLFFEITTGAGDGEDSAAQWSTHSWTCEQNPYIQLRDVPEELWKKEMARAENAGYSNARVRSWLDSKLKQNNWTEDHPTYRREWLGLWVLDIGALVYPYDHKVNGLGPILPQNDNGLPWQFILGADVGYEDDTAFTVVAFKYDSPHIYVVHAEKKPHMIPSAVAARIEQLRERFPFYDVVMDTGGIGKGYAEECSQRYGIHVEKAEKTRKRAFQEIMRGELLSGVVQVLSGRATQTLRDEWGRLVWSEDKSKEDDRFPNHSSDATLYAWRRARTYHRTKYDDRDKTTEERELERAAEFKKQLAKRMKGRANTKQARKLALLKFASGQ